VRGDMYTPPCPLKPDIVTTINASSPYEASDWPADSSGDSTQLADGSTDVYPVSEVLTYLSDVADNPIAPDRYTNPTWGTAGDLKITYCEGDLDVNGLSGYGILAVNGEVTLGGRISWNGIIIVSGEMTLNGGGNQSMNGAIIANTGTTINGRPDVYYDCNAVDNIEEQYMTYPLYSWEES
ncbi:MAG: hypothetical protein V3S89_03645, partial [Desulfobacterales bacterium]